MHITEVRIWQAKHRLDSGVEFLDWRHEIDVILPDGTTLSVDSEDGQQSIVHSVDIETNVEELKEKTKIIIYFLTSSGGIEFQKGLKVHSTLGLPKDSTTLAVSTLFVSTSTLVYLKGC